MDQLAFLSSESLVTRLSEVMRENLRLWEGREEMMFGYKEAGELRSLAREVLCRSVRLARTARLFRDLTSRVPAQRERVEKEILAMLGPRDVRNLGAAAEGDLVYPIFTPLRAVNANSRIASGRMFTVFKVHQDDGMLTISLDEMPPSLHYLASCFVLREHARVVSFPLTVCR